MVPVVEARVDEPGDGRVPVVVVQYSNGATIREAQPDVDVARRSVAAFQARAWFGR
jgi:hypothetical protein